MHNYFLINVAVSDKNKLHSNLVKGKIIINIDLTSELDYYELCLTTRRNQSQSNRSQ